MALYLGSEKVGVTIARGSNSGDGVKCVRGTAMSNSEGVITFPEVDFTPNMIVVWNVVEVDNKQIAEENGEDWEEGFIQYTYDGIMLFAVYQNGRWISQGLEDDSGSVHITNSSWTGGLHDSHPYSSSGIDEVDGIYSYNLARFPQNGNEGADLHDFTDVEFNYAIYG